MNCFIYYSCICKTFDVSTLRAVYSLIQAFVRYGFAIAKLSTTPGLLDHLLTRDREVEYEGITTLFLFYFIIIINFLAFGFGLWCTSFSIHC
jgi:hypothetical protein